MATIIAGRFETQAHADAAIDALGQEGYGPDDLTSFYLNPPGMHDMYPIGGDAHHDAGTKEAGKTAATGAALGGVTGLALGTAVAIAADSGLAAVAAVTGAGVGAYVGSLAGGLSGTEAPKPQESSTEEPAERDAGIVVAVRTDRVGNEQKVIERLRTHGAHGVERATGAWLPGAKPAWTDFDPRRTPRLV